MKRTEVKPLAGARRKRTFDAPLKPRKPRGLAADMLALAMDLMRLARGFDADHYIHGESELVRSIARRIRAVVKQHVKKVKG